jgi:uncharacterized protein (TIGR02246 family)
MRLCSLSARVLTVVVLLVCTNTGFAQDATGRQQVDLFNQKFTDAIRHMDNAAVMNLWAEDGVSLLPNMPPIAGKPAIQKFMNEVTSKTRGYKVVSHDNDFRDIQVSGDWASEWALTTQVVQPPDNKPVLTIHGKMLLVLHREKSGQWKIEEESWTSAPTPNQP